MSRPRIAWFSCLDSTGGSVSAYAASLLVPRLSSRFSIDLFHDHFDDKGAHFLSAFRRHREEPYDLFFYSLEDGRASYFVRAHLGLEPGVVWFHDLLFADDGPEPLLNSPWSEVVRRFSDASLPWPRRDAEFLKESKWGTREAAYSLLPLFSSERNLSEFRRNFPTRIGADSSYFLPCPVENVPMAERATGVRIGWCGSPRIEHRAHKLLQAIASLGSDVECLWLVGRDEADEAARLVSEWGLQSVLIERGRSPQRWAQIVSTLDIALHPLFSVYGEVTPYLSLSMMAGLPCIVTRFGSTEYLPDTLVFKVEAGDTEALQMSAALEAILSRRVLVPSHQIREFAQEQWSVEVVARECENVLMKAISTVRPYRARWGELQREARSAVIEENRVRWDSRSGSALSEVCRDLWG